MPKEIIAKRREYQRLFYQRHPEKKQEYRKKYMANSVSCECKTIVLKRSLKRHKSSITHKRRMDYIFRMEKLELLYFLDNYGYVFCMV